MDPVVNHGAESEDFDFLDLLDLESLQEIQDAFSSAVHVASIITYPDGSPITEPSNFCRLCQGIIRGTRKGFINCKKSDAILGRPREGPFVHRCFSGSLMDAGVSITIGGRHVANWLIGQIRDEDFDQDEALEYARKIGVGEEEYRKALDEVPKMSKRQFEAIAKALYLIANQLSDLAYQKYLMILSDCRLKSANVELEKNVAARTAELTEALKELEFSQELLIQQEKAAVLGNLVAGIAHEINTPLGICVTSVSYLDELIGRFVAAPDDAGILRDLRDCANLIRTNIDRASDLVSNFKRIAVDHGDPMVTDFSLKECIEGTFMGFVHELKVSGVSWNVTLDEDYSVHGDRSQWTQVFSNLIGNSLTHGFGSETDDRDRVIAVSVENHGDHGGRRFVRIVYQDNGKGVVETVAARIFEPYVTTKRHHGGSGLGLHIIATVLSQDMEGTIRLDESYGDGARFIIIVPLSPTRLSREGKKTQ